MSFDNSYLLLGQTGVGKSSLIKILSGNESIRIGDSRKSETQDVESYNCTYDNFNYTLIDTPGYDDSNGNDPKNYAHIRSILSTGKFKIKGILLLLSFQDARFGESHRKGLEKIVSLFPLDNFWDYIIIVFTKTFCDEDDNIEELKEKALKDYKEIFDVLISAFNRAKNINKIQFSSIKTVFINSKIKTKKINNQKELLSIIKNNSDLDPFFHTIKSEEKNEKVMIINKSNKNLGDLFDVKYKVYYYYNEKGKKVKTISRPIDKIFIKQIEKKEFDENFHENCINVTADSLGVILISGICGFGLSFFCPQVALVALTIYKGAIYTYWGSLGINVAKYACEYLSNKEFNEQKIIDELIIEEENL